MCLQVGDLPLAVIPVHMAVVGCPVSSLRTTSYTTDQAQKEPAIRCSMLSLSLCSLVAPETLQPPGWAAHVGLLFFSWARAIGATYKKVPGQGFPGGRWPQGTWPPPFRGAEVASSQCGPRSAPALGPLAQQNWNQRSLLRAGDWIARAQGSPRAWLTWCQLGKPQPWVSLILE